MPNEQPEQSILKSGEKFAKEEATRATTLGVEGQLPGSGAPGEVTTTIATSGSTKWFDWMGGAWIKRKFQRGGTSAGVKGEIKF